MVMREIEKSIMESISNRAAPFQGVSFTQGSHYSEENDSDCTRMCTVVLCNVHSNQGQSSSFTYFLGNNLTPQTQSGMALPKTQFASQ